MGRKKKWNGDKELNYMDNETPPLSHSSPWLLIDLRIVAFQLRQHEASSTGFFVGPCQTLPPTFHRAYEIKVNYSVSLILAWNLQSRLQERLRVISTFRAVC